MAAYSIRVYNIINYPSDIMLNLGHRQILIIPLHKRAKKVIYMGLLRIYRSWVIGLINISFTFT